MAKEERRQRFCARCVSKFLTIYVRVFRFLLGICNTLSFVEQHLARLSSSVANKPESVTFKPYTSEQIVEILSHRFKNRMVRFGECFKYYFKV